MSNTDPLIYIIAGEPSGDALGARLIAALRVASEGRIRFAGIGGTSMAREGLFSLFDPAEIAIIGLLEILPHIPKILFRVQETVADIVRRRPAVLVTIDSWGFTGRVNKILRALQLPILQIHYVAPMVWAWYERRAADLARCVDHLITLFPHESVYFARAGVSVVCVGHPIIESGAGWGDGSAFRSRYALANTAPLLCVLPGSRSCEVKRLLPVIARTVKQLSLKRPNLQVVLPTVDSMKDYVLKNVRTWTNPVKVVYTARDKYDAFAAADIALTAAGTVVLELALAQLPMIVTYRVTSISAWIFRRLSQVRYINLVNLLLDRPVVPELLQAQCQPTLLAAEVERLLDDATARATQRVAFHEATRRLGYGGLAPSIRAAQLILGFLDRQRQQ
ncbi:Lipid-A-disaccharide synthase [invertebrate metagenome]|uniref:lipid-A-disaccharide synthase n=1 Tax=invertebrate metagenome TaxID=1711999 RepID=A0A484H706_9ZZZZ